MKKNKSDISFASFKKDFGLNKKDFPKFNPSKPEDYSKNFINIQTIKPIYSTSPKTPIKISTYLER